MTTDPDSFEWKPAEPRRNIRALSWVAIVVACAGLGVALGQLQPVERLVSAIERNGVVKAPSTDPLLASTLIPEPSARQGADPGAIRKVVLLNPGTVNEEERSAAAEGAVQGLELEPVPMRVPTTQAQPKAPPPPTPAGNRRERQVLVVVRRLVPPYDRKVLRGTITHGRLVLDSRDSRGITVR